MTKTITKTITKAIHQEEDIITKIEDGVDAPNTSSGWCPVETPRWSMQAVYGSFGINKKPSWANAGPPVIKRENGSAFGRKLDPRVISPQGFNPNSGKPVFQTNAQRNHRKLPQRGFSVSQQIAQMTATAPPFSNVLPKVLKTRHF